MQRKFRLTRSEDFKRVRRSGKSYAHPLVVLIVHTHEARSTTPRVLGGSPVGTRPAGAASPALGRAGVDQPRLRVGVAAGRTVGTAVHRNRAKRLLREAIRSLVPQITPGLDLILIARPGLATATLEQTRQALLTLLQRAQIIIPLHES